MTLLSAIHVRILMRRLHKLERRRKDVETLEQAMRLVGEMMEIRTKLKTLGVMTMDDYLKERKKRPKIWGRVKREPA